jgi:glycosyltransferase involved in cell wall biosynthesis
MFLGRISQKKGIENLLHALRKLDDSSIELAIYGTGPADYESAVMQLAGDLGFARGMVTFAGQVDGERKRQAFLASDVCVVPSFSENFCMVVAEALAHGVPVIASHGTPWSGVEAKQCGLWVDTSPDSLAQAIVRIRTMPLAEMGSRGRDWMKREYGWDTVAVAMEQVYSGLVKQNHKLVGAPTV